MNFSGYIMRGFLEGRLRGNHEAEAEFIGRSLEILEWGQKAWKGIPFTQKGVIFKDTFVRGVRSMYLDALMHVSLTFIMSTRSELTILPMQGTRRKPHEIPFRNSTRNGGNCH
jgi:hypothetical protein